MADAVHYLVNKICAAWRSNKVVSVLFLDVEGAFPNAVTSRLLHNLKKRRIPTIIVDFVRLLLTNRRTRLRFDDCTSEVIHITNGIGQGDPLSMLLYILYNADLLDLPDNPQTEDALGYVDDIALVATGYNLEDTTNRLSAMMTKQDGGLQWSTEHNSRFEVSKSAILHFSKKSIPDPDSDNGRVPLSRPDLVLNGQTVQEVTSYKYLGITVDAHLKWKEQAQRATANATKWILQFRRLSRPSTGVSAKLMRQLYLAVALPKITYGIDVWYYPPTKPAGYTKNVGSVAALRNLQKTQRIAALAITGTLRSSPNDYIDIHAGILPMELALLKACHNAMVRLLTLPDTHPLYQIIRTAKRHPPTKHLSPINILLKRLQLCNIKIETILPAASIPRQPSRFALITDSSRENSIASELGDDADYRVFSDGSGHDNGIGAAAMLYRKGRISAIKKLQMFLGTPEEHNTYEAEAIGVLLAIWMLFNTPETIGKKVSLYTDNQSVISALASQGAKSGQYLLNAVRTAANAVGCKLTIRWISGHSKVKGNEDVDRLTKDAAEGRSSAAVNLPHLLRTPLPVSASATKQKYMASLKHQWSAAWNASPRKARIAQFGGEFPYSKFRKQVFMLSRKQSSTILQLRSAHFPLNAYLCRIGKTDSNRCQECDPDQEGPQPVETVNHFLFDCAAHDQAREELTAKIGRNFLNLADIMANTDRMKALVTFVNRTQRLAN